VFNGYPSWNKRQLLSRLAGERPAVPIQWRQVTTAFLPEPHDTAGTPPAPLSGARLLVLNSPLNPTPAPAFRMRRPLGGQSATRCVAEENALRSPGMNRRSTLLYEQVYWDADLRRALSQRRAAACFRPEVGALLHHSGWTASPRCSQRPVLRVGWVCPPANLTAQFQTPFFWVTFRPPGASAGRGRSARREYAGRPGGRSPRPVRTMQTGSSQGGSTQLHAGMLCRCGRDGLPVEVGRTFGRPCISSVRFGGREAAGGYAGGGLRRRERAGCARGLNSTEAHAVLPARNKPAWP